MKIVVLDGYTENPGDLSWSGFEGLGEFTVYDRGSETDKEGEAIARIGDAEIVITNKTPITKRVLDSCPSIRYIGVLATGYNVVDYTYAAKQGIPVTNVPGYGTDTVAQFTFCASAGNLPPCGSSFRGSTRGSMGAVCGFQFL